MQGSRLFPSLIECSSMAGDGDKADSLQHFEFNVEIGYYTLQYSIYYINILYKYKFNLYLKFHLKLCWGCFMEKICQKL